MSDPLRPHGLQHTRLLCPSPTPRVYPNLCPLSQWCHPTTSSSGVPFSSCLQSFPESGSFPMSQFFTSGGQNIGVSASASVQYCKAIILQYFFKSELFLKKISAYRDSRGYYTSVQALVVNYDCFIFFLYLSNRNISILCHSYHPQQATCQQVPTCPGHQVVTIYFHTLCYSTSDGNSYLYNAWYFI